MATAPGPCRLAGQCHHADPAMVALALRWAEAAGSLCQGDVAPFLILALKVSRRDSPWHRHPLQHLGMAFRLLISLLTLSSPGPAFR